MGERKTCHVGSDCVDAHAHIAALEQKLAAAEDERDEAVAACFAARVAALDLLGWGLAEAQPDVSEGARDILKPLERITESAVDRAAASAPTPSEGRR